MRDVWCQGLLEGLYQGFLWQVCLEMLTCWKGDTSSSKIEAMDLTFTWQSRLTWEVWKSECFHLQILRTRQRVQCLNRKFGGVCFSWHTGLRIFSGTYGHCLANKKANTPWKTWAGVPFLLNNSVKMVVTWNINNDTENGGIFRMVPLIINPIYTLYSGYLFGIYPTRITQWFLQIPSKTPEIFQFCHRDFDLGIRPKPTGRFKYLSRLWKGTLFSSMVVSVSGSHKRWDVAYNPPEGNI